MSRSDSVGTPPDSSVGSSQKWRETHPFDYVNMGDVVAWATRADRGKLQGHFHPRTPEYQAAKFVALLEEQLGAGITEIQAMIEEKRHADKG